MPTRPPSPQGHAAPAPEALLAALIRRLAPLETLEIKAFLALCVPRRFDAGAHLLEAGERAVWCHFVSRGLAREYYVSARGEEHTRSFIPEGELTGSLLDLLVDAPSVTWIEALEPTHTLAWRLADFDALCTKHPAFQQVARRWAEALYVRKVQREYDMLALPAKERHARWLADPRALDARVTRRALASYLGVTPEHLSRLRRGR